MRIVMTVLDKIGLFNIAIFDQITADGKDAENKLALVRERENAISAALLERGHRG